MRLALAALACIGLLACDVEELPSVTDDHGSDAACVIEATAQPCLDAIDTIDEIGCSNIARPEEADDCALGVILIRGLSNDRTVALEAWRAGPNSAEQAACEDYSSDDAPLACQYTDSAACLDDIAAFGLSGEGFIYACELLTGECAWVERIGSLSGDPFLDYDCHHA